MKLFFRNPTGYVITGLFCLIVGYMFLHQLEYFVANIQKLPVNMRNSYDFTNEVILKLFGQVNFLFTFIIPILTMSSFSAEYEASTIDLYFSSQMSDYELVLGKFISVLSQAAFLLSMTLVYPLVLGNIQLSDFSFLFCGYIGLLLNISCYISLGIFASSLSRNQIISCLAAFVLVLFCWMIGWFGQLSTNYFSTQILNYLSVNIHFSNLMKGILRSSDLCFYVTFITFFVFLTKKRLESRIW